MDRRIQKTRQGLQDALLALLIEKPLEKIDIKEITEYANTARVTFYRHYGTKQELFLDAVEQIYQDFEARFIIHEVEMVMDFTKLPPVYDVFELLAGDRDFYKKIFAGSISALIQERIRYYIVYNVKQTFKTDPQFADLPLTLIGNLIASTVIGNIMWWLSEDLPYSIEEISHITHRMALTGAMAIVSHNLDLPSIEFESKS